MTYYAKIYCEEGVVKEREFENEGMAKIYLAGALDAMEAVDPENDFYHVAIDTTPSKDEDA